MCVSEPMTPVTTTGVLASFMPSERAAVAAGELLGLGRPCGGA